MESLRTKIEEALNKFVVHRRAIDFQRLAFHVASLSWPDLRATTLNSDLGADALVPFQDGKTKLVLACGITGDLTKLKEDCARLREVRPETNEVVFATTSPITEESEQKWREAIRKEFDIGLRDVIQREWIITQLEKEPNRWLCKEYLEIPLAEFQNLPAILPRVRRAAGKLLNACKGEYQFDHQPLIDLSLEELDGREPAAELRLSALPPRLSSGDCCSVTGVPGAGKTFSLIAVGSALAATDSLIPVVVSLRALSHRGDKLIDWILSEPSFQEQGVTASELSNAASAGALLLLLNGWNEIARDAWLATTEAISSFIRQMPGCAVLVASRESLGRDFKFPAREFRIKRLSGDQIRTAIRQAGLEDADRQADFILDSAPLSEMAAVPLFLQAIIREAKSGNELPLGKQAMLRRMVERAVEEHRSDLEHGDVGKHALHYLADLAWEMTRTGKTTILEREAYQTIANTVHKLKNEALLGAEPAPPDILRQLLAGHVLISLSGNDVAFTHQLIQEHFAATKIVAVLGERNEKPELSLENLKDYQWEQPFLLALEDLGEQNRSAEIRILLDWFRFLDFETACHMVGIVSNFWLEVRDLFEPVIRHLASSGNVNARWLAARCAAATGQPSFHDLVWTALEGHPKGTSDCFEGISSTFLLRALGDGFSKKLLEVPEEEFRFEALARVGRAPTAKSLRLAETLAAKDPALRVRRLAFRQLFLSGRRGWLRLFFLDAKRQRWSLGTLYVLQASRHCTVSRFRKFAATVFETQTTIKERINTFSLWDQVDSVGASVMARKEYDRLAQVGPNSPQDSEWRLFCLRTGARDDQNWAAPRLVREVLSPDGITAINFQLPSVLPDQKRAIVVEQLLPELVKRGHTAVGTTRQVAELAPLTATSWLLRAIVRRSHESTDQEERQSLRQLLHEVSHAAVVEAAMHADFENPNPAELRVLLAAVSVGFPGGNPKALQPLSNQELMAYRERLLHWLSLLPELDQESAPAWANCATLIGELKHPDDAELVYKMLRADEARVVEQVETRTREVEAWETSGRKPTPPGPIIRASYGNWNIAALANIPGKRCMEIMIELLSHPDHIGVAAHTLANDAGAEQIDLSGSIHSRPRFDLIYEKRMARKPLDQQASEYEAAIKRAIDLRLRQHPIYQSQLLFSALSAVARLSGPDNESWILERLERYFPDASVESVLETITLAGGSLPGQRILPFVRKTVAFALSEPWSNYDKTFLVTKALISLFFSDSPGLAIELLKGEVAWFLRSHQFRSLLQILVWERSSVVDILLRELSSHDFESDDTREAVLECLAERALKRNDHPAVLEAANQLIEVTRLNPASMARRGISRLAAENESFRRRLFAQARAAQSINEAAGWLRFISEIGGNDGVRAAFELAERFGEQLGVVSSLAPNKQEGTSLGFQGWFYRIGGARSSRALYYLPDIMAKLHDFASSPDPVMGAAAERALLWIERERILAGVPSTGSRVLPPRPKNGSKGSPWQLRLQFDRITKTG